MAKSENARKSMGAMALVVLGVVANVVGIAGTVAGWGKSTTAVALLAAPASTTTTAAPASTTTAQAATTTLPAVAAQTASEFVLALDRALSASDQKFLIARLHPAVIARYGTAQCVAFYRGAHDTGEHFVLRGTPSAPAEFAWKSDGKTTVIHNVITVPADLVSAATTTRVAVHTAAVNGTYRFFGDCGTPIG